jgi:hypothetical protein
MLSRRPGSAPSSQPASHPAANASPAPTASTSVTSYGSARRTMPSDSSMAPFAPNLTSTCRGPRAARALARSTGSSASAISRPSASVANSTSTSPTASRSQVPASSCVHRPRR